MRYAIPVIFALALASCAPYPPPAPPPPPTPPPPPVAAMPAPPPPVQAAPPHVMRTAIGPVLADAQGMTLYIFAKDPPGHSMCNGPCAALWPPLLAPPHVMRTRRFSIIVRADGAHQWAHRGKPLYIYARDPGPGATAGQGFRNVWYVGRP